MSVGQEFWVVAAGCAGGGDEKESYFRSLNSTSNLTTKSGQGPWKFNVPDGLMFGSFDNLIRLTDDLQKHDSQVDGILHRLERQYLELDSKAAFKVKSQRQEKDFLEYVNSWQWDEAKYPKTRTITDNLNLLMSSINKIDEEARNKTQQYNDMKSQRGNLAKKEAANLLTRDLVDVLTPDIVLQNGNHDDDFIYTNQITTICVVLSRGADKDFLNCYETMSPNVVPQSARQFKQATDKDGNTVWRAVLFKSDAEAFRRACRERKFLPREFTYDLAGYKQLQSDRQQSEDAVTRQHSLVTLLYQAAWSDSMVAWMHVKAMRVFVESVLRFGMPPRFAAFIVSPKANATVPARKVLADILGKGKPAQPYGEDKAAAGDDDEEYYPYVSLSFTAFAVPRG